MLNNDVTVTATPLHPMDIPSSLAANAGTGYEQDIKAFLAKPVKIDSNTFSAATIAGIISTYNLPYDLFSKEVYKRKLQGYLGIRGTIVLRIQINATKFQQGRLILCYNPMNDVQDFDRLDSAMLATQLPHVQLDIATQTEAVLEIPFVSNYTHFGLVSAEGAWATAYLYRYLPFRVGAGSTTCDYTVWAHMENVELVTPTANKGYIAQMASDRLKSKKRDVSSQEAKAMSEGPVSLALSKVSAAATVLEGIPMLSTFAAPVAWATQIVGDIASIFGWSKPTNELVNERRNVSTYQFENNCDATDNVYSLGLMTTNAVSILPGLGGTDADEMSMSFLSSVFAYTKTVQWTTANAVGDEIMKIDLKPDEFILTGASGLFNFTPLSFFFTIFNYYRGSFKFRFKFSKTIFHSGRLMLVYTPGYNANGTVNTVTIDESAYTYREVLDMRDACEFEFTIPYASVRPYLKTTQAYGCLTMLVLNPLVAPDIVSTTIDFAVEVAGDHDFEFFDPKPPITVPCTQGSIAAQMSSDRVGDIHPHTSGSIGSSEVTGRGTISSQLCVGERILSIKQLLSRACEFQNNLETDLTGLAIRPFDMYNSVVDFPYTGTALNYFDADYLTTFSSFYKFSRGGVCVRYQMRNLFPVSESKWIVPKLNSDSTVPIITPSAPETCRSHITESVITGNTVSARIPMYHPTHCRVNVPFTRTNLLAPLAREVEPYTNSQYVSILNAAGTGGTGIALRSAADDFQLGFFVGIPPMGLKSTLNP